MLLRIPQVLKPTQAQEFVERLRGAQWADGRATAGYQSSRAKDNLQLPDSDPAARELSAVVRTALDQSPLFFSAALPLRIFTPLFNRYRSGHAFGNHIDNAIRYDRTAGAGVIPVRTDLSATLFLNPPEEYDGGELTITSASDVQKIKLPAGDMLLYPASTVHRVEPIARGERFASFFWIQSLVRDAGQRSLLFDLDRSIQKLNQTNLDHPAMVDLVGVYHNLLRQWSEV